MEELSESYRTLLYLLYGEGTDGTDVKPLESVKELIVSTYRQYGVSMWMAYRKFRDLDTGKERVIYITTDLMKIRLTMTQKNV